MNSLTIRCLAMASALAGFLYLSAIANAQNTEQAIDTSKVYQLEEVIISASRFAEDPASVGRNVSVITREEIDRSVHSSVAGLLAEQESVHMIGNGQTPGSLQQGFIRNANNHHSLVMIDGVRISDPSTVNDGIDLSELSLLGVERIEIVRGSHSTLYGSSAIGGVVNIITKKQSEEGFHTIVDTKHGIFNSGAYATTNNALINYSGTNGFYVDLGVSQKYSNGLDAAIDTVSGSNTFNTNDRDGFRKLDLLGKVGYQSNDLNLYASFRNVDQTSEVDQGAFVDDDNAQTDFRRTLLNYGAEYRLSNNFSLNYDGAYSDLQRDFVNDSSRVDDQGNYDGTYTETNGEGTLLENELTGSLRTNHTRFIMGLESSVQTMNIHTYTFSSAFNFESETDLDSLDLRETINSAFVHAELSGGLLGESLEAFSLNLGSRLSDHNEFGTHYTYEINPKVQLSNQSLIYAALTSGFNAPSLYQLNAPEQGGPFTTRGNANLEPEESVSYELGWKQSVGASVEFDLSLFKTQVENVIEYVYLWDGNTAPENLTSMDYLGDTYINVSEQDINGIEFGLDVQPIPQLSFGGNLTVTSSTLTFSPDDINESYTGGNHVQIFESGKFVDQEEELESLTRRPQTSASIRGTYRPTAKLSIGITSKFIGSRDDIFFSENIGPFGAQDRTPVDGYNLTDLSVNYAFNSRFSITGKIENLFNTDYVEINGFQTRGRGLFVKGRISL